MVWGNPTPSGFFGQQSGVTGSDPLQANRPSPPRSGYRRNLWLLLIALVVVIAVAVGLTFRHAGSIGELVSSLVGFGRREATGESMVEGQPVGRNDRRRASDAESLETLLKKLPAEDQRQIRQGLAEFEKAVDKAAEKMTAELAAKSRPVTNIAPAAPYASRAVRKARAQSPPQGPAATVPEVQWPRLRLQGVIAGRTAERSTALINGVPVQVGEAIEGARLVAIHADRVELEKEGIVRSLRFGETW